MRLSLRPFNVTFPVCLNVCQNFGQLEPMKNDKKNPRVTRAHTAEREDDEAVRQQGVL